MDICNKVYIYDGSFDGFLCCVFRAFEKKEEPIDISTDNVTLLECINIITETDKSLRVEKWLKNLGQALTDVVTLVFLSEEVGMELNLLRLLRLANQKGKYTLTDLNNPLVIKNIHLARAVKREAHRMIEFLRFSDYDGNLIAVINPKYYILPLISQHFHNRLPNETFFIYDEIHRVGLAHANKKTEIFPVDNFESLPPTDEEETFRNLWQLFYDTIEIKQRRNHKLRTQHLPKRFWRNITELKDELNDLSKSI